VAGHERVYGHQGGVTGQGQNGRDGGPHGQDKLRSPDGQLLRQKTHNTTPKVTKALSTVASTGPSILGSTRPANAVKATLTTARR